MRSSGWSSIELNSPLRGPGLEVGEAVALWVGKGQSAPDRVRVAAGSQFQVLAGAQAQQPSQGGIYSLWTGNRVEVDDWT